MENHGLIARKIGMTRMVDDQGQMIPVTLLQVAPQKVTKVLTPERDGYHGIQIGYYEKPEKRLRKPDVARLRKAGVDQNFTRFREFRLDEAMGEVATGDARDLALLEGVKTIDATGLTKGCGFQSAIKRHNYRTGRRTHGSHFHRSPGSLGNCTTPGRVMKNKGMPGHMGNVRITIQNLKVVVVDQEQSLVAIKGSVPGHRDSFLVIKPSIKAKG